MFQNCHSLTSIDISGFNTEKVTRMEGMFCNCMNLKNVVLPDNLKFIDSGQFVYCSSLKEISIPESVTSKLTIGSNGISLNSSKLNVISLPSLSL